MGFGPTPDEWQRGFTFGGSDLICDECRCLVRKTPGDAKAHLDWHERINGR